MVQNVDDLITGKAIRSGTSRGMSERVKSLLVEPKATLSEIIYPPLVLEAAAFPPLQIEGMAAAVFESGTSDELESGEVLEKEFVRLLVSRSSPPPPTPPTK